MEIRKLEAFCKVVECKSFTRAAEQLLLAQPTISEHVRSLEEELGQKLLDRLGREVEPTPVGNVFYGYARKILKTRQEAVQAVEQYSGKLVGRIHIGAGTIPGTYVLPELIGKFRLQYPSIKTTLQISSSQNIAESVLSGSFELGVVGVRGGEKSLAWRELFSDELTLAVYPDHPWAHRQSVDLESLVVEPFIMREPGSGTRRVFADILEGRGIKEGDLQEVAEIGSTTAIKEAIKAGIGISVLSKCAVQDDVDCGRLKAIGIKGHELKRSFYLIQRKNREISPVASVFRKYLCEYAEQELKE